MSKQPVVITYYITPQISVQITPSGSGFSTAFVAIYSGLQQVWSATLLQAAPTATIPLLVLGSASLDAGGTFTLTIPTADQNGFVQMDATLVSGPNSTVIDSSVASWPITGPTDQAALAGAGAASNA